MATPADVLRLARDGETLTVEFKRGTRSTLNDADIVEAVVCLANGSGGVLLLGVEDDGELSGLAARHGQRTDPDLLRALILNTTDEPVPVEVEVLDVDGVMIGVVTVPDMAAPVGTSTGKYLRRALRTDGRPQCLPYRAHEMLSAGLAAHGRDYAVIPAVGASAADLDPEEFARFRRLCAKGRGDRVLAQASDADILSALRLSLPEQGGTITLGAILLFGRAEALTRHVPSAEVLFQETRQDRLVTSESLRLPLLSAAEAVYDRLSARNSEQEILTGMLRVSVPRLPDQTIRESVANALVHRDYTRHEPISVDLNEDRLRVRSPGGLPRGITLANLLEDSSPRSPVLAEAFKRAGVVDRAGRGIRQMYDVLLRTGRGEPDYSGTHDDAVVVALPTSDADLELVRFIAQHENATSSPLTLVQLRLLREIKTAGPSTLRELAAALAQSESLIRAETSRLAAAGLLEPRGQGRQRRFHLTASFHRSAESAEYIRLLDTDPIQQDQVMLTYVDRFGSITRRTAAELCRLSPQQARVVLKRLVDQGELRLVGERRGAHYVRPVAP